MKIGYGEEVAKYDRSSTREGREDPPQGFGVRLPCGAFELMAASAKAPEARRTPGRCRAGHATSKSRLLAGGITCGFVIFFLFGCAVGPNYKRPPLETPPAFRGGNIEDTNTLADLAWSQVFHDEALQDLIRTGLTNNYDVRIAATRIEQARQQVAEARAGFFPQFNYSVLAAKGKNVSAGGEPSPGGSTGGEVAVYGSAAWEIDIWGRIRRLTESARAQFLATEDARRGVVVSLIADIAQNYLQLLALDEQLEIARQTTNSFAVSLKIFTDRLQGGLGSRLETASARALMESAAATIPSLERQIVFEENQIPHALRSRGPHQSAGPAMASGDASGGFQSCG